MPKRLTATDKWARPWFRNLPAAYKLLWLYILDNCDMAGIWYVDIKLANFKIDVRVSLEMAKVHLGKQIEILEDGRRWWIKDFVAFQYGKLSEGNRVHSAVLSNLEKHGLPTSLFKAEARPFLGSKDKEKDKGNGNLKEATGDLFGKPEQRRPPFVKPTLEEVSAYCRARKNGIDPLAWLAFYEANGWRVGRNPMKNWKAAVVTWEKRNGSSNGGGPQRDINQPRPRHYPSAAEIAAAEKRWEEANSATR